MPVLLRFLDWRRLKKLQVEGILYANPNPVPNVVLDLARESLVSSSGALLLGEAIRVAGLGCGLSASLMSWRPTGAVMI